MTELRKGTGRYIAVYELDPDTFGYSVSIAGMSECCTHGSTITEARERIREVLGLWVDDAATAEILDSPKLSIPSVNRRTNEAFARCLERLAKQVRADPDPVRGYAVVLLAGRNIATQYEAELDYPSLVGGIELLKERLMRGWREEWGN